MEPLVQQSLLCGCGSSALFARGRCGRCYRAYRLSREKFAGLRQAAFLRDGGCCLTCGSAERILLHHRWPGKESLKWYATSCRRCHPMLHFRRRLPFGVSPAFRALWRELHRDQADQLELPFFAADPVIQQALFAAA